uniref:TctD transcriptional regulator n=1 Tax=Polysiphonia scopulorum TaxID=257860 RepID=A0A1Z1MIV7_9FLOR|nr:hypothetical protein [Polysiphonia scopulorum]ARW65681.1 hypothetical protein [Polysiphonia scopulorum]
MKKILLVDDDNNLCNLLSSYLVAFKFSVNSVYNVPTALAIVKKDCPDLIISDVMMQGLNGYDFIKLLKLDRSLFYLPVIFLTAKGMTADRIKGYNLGCHAYLTKPFDPEELVAIINNIMLFHAQLNALSRYSNVSDYKIETNDLTLTSREKSVLDLVVKGYMNKEIAIHLSVSSRNVEKYITRLLKKTNTRNRVELINSFFNIF